MKSYKSAIILALIILAAGMNYLYSMEARSFRVYLSMDKLKYYNSDEIILNIRIKNITDDPAAFYVYDSPDRIDIFDRARGDTADYTTFKPVVYDMNGRDAELVVPYITGEKNKTETLSWMVKREIKLGPGETFIHKQNLRRIYDILPERRYRLKMHFFPFIGDRENENFVVVSSNEIKFRVSRDRSYQAYKDKDSGSVMLTPGEVVLLLINAEREKSFEKAVKFLDIDKFIHSYPDFSRRYDISDDLEKKNIEKEFIRYLINRRDDPLAEYRIVSEEIEESGLVAHVSVEAKREGLIKPARYRYLYRLEKNSKNDYIWLVAGLEALVIRDIRK
ncbi:MAG TPA: hypothetical protein PK358_02800 [Spirochaetota bacterium]|nr:hypothetical protein [Spirochaetota bacterium]HPJ33736.1 hypothetical protein [Spirochaetota bacterium]